MTARKKAAAAKPEHEASLEAISDQIISLTKKHPLEMCAAALVGGFLLSKVVKNPFALVGAIAAKNLIGTAVREFGSDE